LGFERGASIVTTTDAGAPPYDRLSLHERTEYVIASQQKTGRTWVRPVRVLPAPRGWRGRPIDHMDL
jgi:hypothetical protein